MRPRRGRRGRSARLVRAAGRNCTRVAWTGHCSRPPPASAASRCTNHSASAPTRMRPKRKGKRKRRGGGEKTVAHPPRKGEEASTPKCPRLRTRDIESGVREQFSPGKPKTLNASMNCETRLLKRSLLLIYLCLPVVPQLHLPHYLCSGSAPLRILRQLLLCQT